ncbi:pimeloyl-ACP methyl ester carboxylesterase [Rhodopseudomonas thermotolerans]|uniref:Pimeloyl-ACP methyl ester carboxylesterase n=2 Tax=Rhodopseudomonas TaxID=1073 RepID=A0A336JNH7_9BRAD|nr:MULTISPECIES: alpha/beta hydrolase [Rhodopseudomonas]RED33219.1 pimeloyl-ACP methyl ester carboxylesterase [Rhodopseudomonas pentothenatexigens]REF93968.1 pimeloyl-ACP methyl ester carboxylesterase [Rhodopseudomonas thermotolerans]SSW91295.1 pimeloyl-ACP methyl ester carboxylesterase [Rhodopseudomonas pentothenatexigens]
MTAPPKTLPTVVLVHGAWADGSSWRLVVPLLLDKGIPVVAVQNPTTSLAADVEATRLALDAIEGPVVLVGHSWGGAVITQAGNDPKVKALVFVAALPPKADESVGDLVGSHPSPPGLSQIIDDGRGMLKLSPEGWVRDVAQDIPEQDARVLAVVQPPLPASTFGDRITEAAWATRPNWFIVSAADRVVSIELQRELAARLNARTTELNSSHLSILSQPRAVADVIVEAVDSVAVAG